VVTFSATIFDDWRSWPRDWTTTLCGGTVMPLSAFPNSGGPLVTSVMTETSASAAEPPVFARYSSMVPAVA
jgi:hypothetical protein